MREVHETEDSPDVPAPDRVKDCPLVWLSVRSRYGDFPAVRFSLDPGADASAIPIALARRLGIAFPQDEASRATAAGLVGRADRFRGLLNVQIAGVEYSWPCDFIDAPGPSSVDPYGVIGRAGFLDDFAFCVNKPYFTLRRRKLWAIFLPPWTPKHDAGEPL
jgi:hypothetical protein